MGAGDWGAGMDALLAEDPHALGPFRLVGRLGAGGMGQVYLGEDATGRLAAIKVVHPALVGDPHFRARFGREIATGRRVRAPWTPAVLAADNDGPRPWLATEYVAGPSLTDAVRQDGPLPERAVAVLTRCLAEALAALHADGVVHRDVKPSNVLLAADGPRLIDFGIARAADATRLTHTGLALGTPAYMSPEQAAGGEPGPASDVFSLGAVLVFAATGVGPFGPPTDVVTTLRRVVAGRPDLSAVPAALRGVLEACLAREPSDRPTPAQLAAGTPLPPQLPTWVPPTPVTAVTAAATAGPAPRRPRLAAGLMVAVAVALVAGVGTLIGTGLGVGPARTVQALPASPAPSSAVLPAPAPTGAVAAPPSAVEAQLVPNQVPGWLSTVSTTRNAAYDVPPGWEPQSPSLLRGYETADTRVLMSGVATLTAAPCPGDPEPRVLAWSGVTGSLSGVTDTAALEVAQRWTDYFAVEGKPEPRARSGPPVAVAVNGMKGTHVVTDIEVPGADGCRVAPRTVIHTVALPGSGGQSVVWVLLGVPDTPGVLPDGDLERVFGSLRPAGLEEKCDPARDTVGSWC